LAGESAGPTKRAKDRLTNLLLLLVSAIVLALAVGVLGSLLVVYVQTRVFYAILFLPSAMTTVVLSYCLFYFYVFLPNSTINRDVRVLMIYDRQEGTIIEDPFDGYQPQGMARQAFLRFKGELPEEANRRISERPSVQKLQRFVFSDLMEFLLVSWLQGQLMGDGKGGLEKDERKELPPELTRNIFVSFFQRLEPKGPTDIAMKQLEPTLPKDIRITFESPFPFENIIDPNTFKFDLSGNYCNIRMSGLLTGISPVTSMMSGPSPSFEGVHMRKYWMDELFKNFGHLARVTFLIRIEAKLKPRFGFIVNWSYLDWADAWINRFAGGEILEGFDFNAFAKLRAKSTLDDIYETVKETNSMIRDKHDLRDDGSRG
jgi:hypothetical protein